MAAVKTVEVWGHKHLTASQWVDTIYLRTKRVGECVEWRGGIRAAGYGQLGRGYRNLRPHRVSYELHCGPIAPGLFVCHRCDNRKCVRPAHLFLGTPRANSADMKAKRRSCRGESVNTAKLTRDQAREIVARYAAGGVSQRQLGREYGVNQTTIGLIVRGGSWN